MRRPKAGQPGRPWRLRLADRLLQVASRCVPKRRGLQVWTSFPDVDDSVVRLLRTRPATQRAVTLLVDDVVTATARLAQVVPDRGGVTVLGKRSLRGTWAYLRAQLVISTHGLFGSLPTPRGQVHLSVWHGDPGKPLGRLIGERPPAVDYTLTCSRTAAAVRALEFDLTPSQVLVTGLPRNDLLAGHGAAGRPGLVGLPPGYRYMVWMPTYRETVSGASHQDGDHRGEADLFRWMEGPDLAALCEQQEVVLLYRTHPLARPRLVPSQHVIPLTDDWLSRSGACLYEVVGGAALLITDVSSVWVDFLLTGRPLVGFFPDLEEYAASRGFALAPHEAWFPGPIARQDDELLAFVSDALTDPDRYAEERARSAALLHENADFESAGRVWRAVEALARRGT